MGEAALWGLVAASSLVVAAEVAFAVRLSRMVVGLVMAFGVGALIASVSFELVEPALGAVPGWQAALALAAGSLVFFLGDRTIASLGGSERKRTDGAGGEEGSGLGIVLGTVLDGIPESAVLGMSLVGGGGVSTALLAGIWVSNLPESLASTVNLTASGWSRSRVRLLWWAIAAVSAASAAVGFVVVANSDRLTGAVVNAFAAGALLTMIADEMAPEAFERSSIRAGLATAAGFAAAVWLASFD